MAEPRHLEPLTIDECFDLLGRQVVTGRRLVLHLADVDERGYR
jgi:hypothetical protein